VDGPGEENWTPPKQNLSLTLHTLHPKVTKFMWCGTSFGWEPVTSFSPWNGLGEPGEACVKWGGKPSTLGAHAPTRGLRQKEQAQVTRRLHYSIHLHNNLVVFKHNCRGLTEELHGGPVDKNHTECHI